VHCAACRGHRAHGARGGATGSSSSMASVRQGWQRGNPGTKGMVQGKVFSGSVPMAATRPRWPAMTAEAPCSIMTTRGVRHDGKAGGKVGGGGAHREANNGGGGGSETGCCRGPPGPVADML
jgi:hypothetical protein